MEATPDKPGDPEVRGRVRFAIGVLLMAVNTIANVVGRFVFQHSIFFTEEVNSMIIVLITFLGLGYCTRMARHIRMTAFYDVLNDKLKKILIIFKID